MSRVRFLQPAPLPSGRGHCWCRLLGIIIDGLLERLDRSADLDELGLDDHLEDEPAGMALPQDLLVEQLAAAIEEGIAYTRAQAMLLATDAANLSLWLATGPSVLASWLGWSRSETVFVADMFAHCRRAGGNTDEHEVGPVEQMETA